MGRQADDDPLPRARRQRVEDPLLRQRRARLGRCGRQRRGRYRDLQSRQRAGDGGEREGPVARQAAGAALDHGDPAIRSARLRGESLDRPQDACRSEAREIPAEDLAARPAGSFGASHLQLRARRLWHVARGHRLLGRQARAERRPAERARSHRRGRARRGRCALGRGAADVRRSRARSSACASSPSTSRSSKRSKPTG